MDILILSGKGKNVKIDRRLFANFDWVLLGLVLLISGIGILNLYSAGYNLRVTEEHLYTKQMSWILLGLIMMVIAFSVDYHIIIRHAYLIYVVSVLLLFLVSFYGNIVHGSQRWLVIWGFSFQPSELMKLAIIIVLVRYFDDNMEKGYYPANLVILLTIVGIPFFMIVRQPDLGTAMFLMVLFLSMAVFAGIGRKLLIRLGLGGMIFAPLFWFFLKDYQRERILTFLNPERDPLGAGYHIIQSIIAIGSGGVWGKGILKGTQTQLRFLPEQQTDFAFSVFAEEWGFIGSICPDVYISCVDTVGFKDHTIFQRLARGVDGLWSDNVCLLGYIYKYWYGYRHIPCCGNTAPLFQLWWVFDDCSDDRSGSVDECEHEEVYPSTMMALIVPLVSLRRGTKRGDLE